jgi:hypothetical protein
MQGICMEETINSNIPEQPDDARGRGREHDRI